MAQLVSTIGIIIGVVLLIISTKKHINYHKDKLIN